jgi:hypothetical protein
MPTAFGTFKNAPTLDCVCDTCNQFFGRELELPLARESGEGLLRYVFGQKRREDFRDFHKDAVRVTLQGGLWHGMRVQLFYDSQTADLVIGPQGPQVGFKRRGTEGYEFFLMDELIESVKGRADIDIQARPLFFLRDSDREEMLRRLEAIGIRKRYEDEVPGPAGPGESMPVETSSEINGHLKRAVAKIAFDYLAWSLGAEFVLDPMFDKIRNFVRYATDLGFPIVQASTLPILADDARDERQTRGHLVKVNLDETGLNLGGWVSLFNELTYVVVLARPYGGIHRPDLRRGHMFDWESSEIHELAVISSSIALPPSLRRNRPA